MISRLVVLLAALAGASAPTHAMVGPTSDGGAYAPHVVMVLAQAAGGAGFCSGAVVGPNLVLTAAHCVSSPQATRVHFRDRSGSPVLANVRRIARHPLYRADAVKARAKSVDLALVQTAEPLPGSFSSVGITDASSAPGAAFEIAGFGVSREGAASTSGVLRSATLRLREPVSNILLWLDSAEGAGACTGDSGAPVFAGGALVGIVAFAQARSGRGCGGLTQAVRVAPFRDWIERTTAEWR
jgi:secreted trypsin-like serine protease